MLSDDAAAKTESKHTPRFSGNFRSVITRTVKDAASVCCYAASLEAALKNPTTFGLQPDQRENASLSVRPLEQYRTTIISTNEKWNKAIEELEENQRTIEQDYQDDYYDTLLEKHTDFRDGEEEEMEEGPTPLDAFLNDLDHYLRFLQLHSENRPSSESLSARSPESIHEDDATHGGGRSNLTPLAAQNQLPCSGAAAAAPSQQEEVTVPDTGSGSASAPVAAPSKEDYRLAHVKTVAKLNTSATVSQDPPLSTPPQFPAGQHSIPLSPPHVLFSQSPNDSLSRVPAGQFAQSVIGADEGNDVRRDARPPDRCNPRDHLPRPQRVDAVHGLPPGGSYAVPPIYHPFPAPRPSLALQLPAMPLPSFNGSEPWAFSTFINTFEAIVIPESLTDFQKLHYLRSCLDGEALDAIASILAREGCYEKAKERLDSIYKSDTQQMSALIRQKIQNFKRLPGDCGSRAELKAIRDFLTLVEQLVNSEADNAFLTDAVVSKLPERVVKKAIKFRIENPSIGTVALLEKLETSALKDVTVERLTDVNKKGLKENKKENIRVAVEADEQENHTDDEDEKTKSIVQSVGPRSESKKDRRCAFCEKHPAGQEERCRLFSTPDERISRCRMLRLCYRCLVGGASHNFKVCDAVCAHCGGGHHRSLCKKMRLTNNKGNLKERDGVTVGITAQREGEEMIDDNSFEAYYDEMERTMNAEKAMDLMEIMGAATRQDVPFLPRLPSDKLMTFQALLVNQADGQEYPINIMLDPGASCNLLSDKIAKILRMQPKGSAETGFSGIGAKESEFKEHNIHKLVIKTTVRDSQQLTLEAYEFPAPLTGPERHFEFPSKDRQFVKREKLESAMLCDADGPVDVLVGLRHSMEVMNTGKKFITLPSGMRLLPTTLGLVRSCAPIGKAEDTVRCLMPERLYTIHEMDKNDSKETGEVDNMECEKIIDSVHIIDQGKTKLTSLDGITFSLSTVIGICCLLALFLPRVDAKDFSQAINCLPHGVMVNTTPGYGIQVCTSAECRIVSPEANKGSVSVLFAPVISAGPFSIFVKMVTENHTFSSKRDCPGSDVCENMKNDWSLDHLVVPHCYPRTAIAICGFILYGIVVSIVLTVYALCFRQASGAEVLRLLCRWPYLFISRLCRFLWHMISCPIRWLRCQARDRQEERRRARMEETSRSLQEIMGMENPNVLPWIRRPHHRRAPFEPV